MKQRINRFILSLILCSFMVAAHAQNASIVVKGYVLDSGNNQPIPYATVMLKSKSSDKVLNGIITGEDGSFNIISDSILVYVEITYMGYEKLVLKNLSIENDKIDLGNIHLSPNSEVLNVIEVQAEKSTVEFKLDKRVFNVGSDIGSSGMGALDVLNNVPSVNVNIDGQVSLRGNTGVQILINGKPSVLADDGSNALGTLTADMIESIEVVTNPSAKYQAEGTSGIINIILKKEKKKGFNGSASINTGVPNNHSIGASLNRRTEKFNVFTQFGVGYRTRPEYSEQINRNLIRNSVFRSEGIDKRNEQFYNIRLGTDYYINQLNTITLSGNYAYEIETQPAETEFWLYDSLGLISSNYLRNETTSATNPKWQYDLQYKKQFKNNEDHVLLFSGLGSFFGKNKTSEFINTFLQGDESDGNQRAETDFYRADYTFKMDYTNPISKVLSLEAGGLYEINNVGNNYAVFDQQGEDWIPDSALTNNFEYNQKVLGVYGTGSYEKEKWGVKIGFRFENTDLQTVLTTTNEENQQNYTNLFPSLHTSYKINKRFSVQAGYSKRIFRPRLWDLNPFFSVQNIYNIRAGNPNLQPEFADSYELSGIFIFERASLNTSIYHLFTTDVVERVSYYQEDVNITTPINVGQRQKTGLEVNGKYSHKKWLVLTGDFNYGFFVRTGSFESQNFNFSSNQWTLDVTAKFKLPYNLDVEISPNYQSGFQTVQGDVSGFAFADAGIRKKLWKGKGVINMGVRDIFASRIRESVVDQPSFNLYSFSQRGRFVTLGFSYSFGKGEAMTYSGRRH